MKRIIQYSVLCLSMLAGGVFTSCINDPEAGGDEAMVNSEVIVKFQIGNAGVVSRAATEPGWGGDWNEDKITRLSLIVFDKTSGKGKLIEYTDREVNDENIHTWDIPKTDLTRGEVDNASAIYLIANAPADVLPNTFNGTEADLKALELSGLQYSQKQEMFVMDGRGEVGTNGSNKVITVKLARALSKIRIGFSSDTDIRNVSCKFVNYATKAALVSGGNLTATSDVGLISEPDYENTYLTWSDTDTPKKIVFYSYSNEWYDGTKNPVVEEPIDENRQTYILIKAPFEGTEYFYKIPVNKRLPEDNDRVGLTAADFKDLYQLKRNYIYDITVNIDREGGTEDKPVELTLQYQVQPWTDGKGGNIEFD